MMHGAMRKMIIVAAAACAAVILSLFVLYYYRHDPAAGGVPRCMFKVLTGWDCPGCGSQRAFHAALHGRMAEAWAFNPFVFFAVPAALYYAVVEVGRAYWPRLHAASVHPSVQVLMLVAVIVYTVLRNLG